LGYVEIELFQQYFCLEKGDDFVKVAIQQPFEIVDDESCLQALGFALTPLSSTLLFSLVAADTTCSRRIQWNSK
jgi:hypothetical protein